MPDQAFHEQSYIPVLSVRVCGPKAMYTDPRFKAEPYSFPAPPASVVKGVFRSIFGKPEFEWEPSDCGFYSRIRYATTKESVPASTTSMERTIRTVTYLVDPDYIFRCAIRLNPLRVTSDDTPEKYEEMFRRKLKTGDYHRIPCLGRRKFVADCSLVEGPIPEPMPITQDIGSLLFDQIPVDIWKDQFEPIFWQARIVDGVLRYPQELHEKWRPQTMRARHAAHPKCRRDGEEGESSHVS